uniref:Uncharacterized protein n=1 Tax=Malurus cyaneus samueli TaxID=2593467 RepID=A0A8C5UFZ4_9PASS
GDTQHSNTVRGSKYCRIWHQQSRILQALAGIPSTLHHLTARDSVTCLKCQSGNSTRTAQVAGDSTRCYWKTTWMDVAQPICLQNPHQRLLQNLWSHGIRRKVSKGINKGLQEVGAKNHSCRGDLHGE